MKLNFRNFLRQCAAGALITQSAHAGTILTGDTDTPNNQAIPTNYASYGTGTPNVALTWGATGTGSGGSIIRWESYDNWNDRGEVYQMNEANPGTFYTVTFTPDLGFNAIIQSTDFDIWSGGGSYVINWEATGATSGILGSGQVTISAIGLNPVDFGDLQGVASEAVTLKLTMDATSTGQRSYLALDNLAFEQVDSTDQTLTSFTSDRQYIENPVTLSWSIANSGPGMTVTLNNGTTPIDVTGNTNPTTGDGSIQVNPTENTTYTLSLGSGSNLQLTLLTGETLSLGASPNFVLAPNYETTLNWEIQPIGAGLVTLFDGTNTIDVTSDTDSETGQGSKTLSVAKPSTTYTLAVNGSDETQSVRVLAEVASSTAFSVNSTSVSEGTVITVAWTGAAAGDTDWVGIYPAGNFPQTNPSNVWNYLNGTRTPGPGPASGSMEFTLPAGDYYVVMLLNDGYDLAQGPVRFSVTKPVQAVEIIKVESVTKSGDSVTIVWDSKEGKDYDIYASDSLEGDPLMDWESIEMYWPSEGDGTTEFTETLPTPAPTRRFYRIYEY